MAAGSRVIDPVSQLPSLYTAGILIELAMKDHDRSLALTLVIEALALSLMRYGKAVWKLIQEHQQLLKIMNLEQAEHGAVDDPAILRLCGAFDGAVESLFEVKRELFTSTQAEQLCEARDADVAAHPSLKDFLDELCLKVETLLKAIVNSDHL